ncbi:MAG: hypothetical protein HC906_11525 [Bacteroidales bacterium]|nr:hypothetical protein [Bacteroidales bacterium]
MKSKLEWINYQEEKESAQNGMLFLLDVLFHPEHSPVKITGRFSRFSSGSWDSRIYAYENSIPYTFSVPAFNNNGYRIYLLSSVKITSLMGFWIKIGHTHYYNLESIGSGPDEIKGPNLSEIEAMIRIKF